MLEAPSVGSLDERTTAIIRLTVPRADMAHVMRPAVQEIRAALQAQGVAPSGALFAHHLSMNDPAVFDFELGFPVEGPVLADGRVRPGRLPGGRVATAVHRGGYEGLAAAWGTFRRWIEEHGHSRSTDLWEVYTSGPASSPDPAEWRTELHQPLEP